MSDSGSGSGSNGNPAGPPTPPPAQGPSPLPPPPAAAPTGPYTPPPAPAYPPQPPQYVPPPQYGPPPQTPYPAPPQQQPPYQPPAYPQQPQQPQYGAPVYAPPAPQQAYQQPMMQQPGFAPPPAKGGSRTLLIVGIAAVLLIILLAVGGVLANASLSSTYSPGKAVQAYFAAQSRGDVSYMVANANYLKGDNGTDSFFNREAVSAMVGQKENKDVSGVSVSSTVQVDSSTSKVTVAMSWNGNQETETYTVHKDPTRTHFVFYNDWKLDVPASTVTITLPNQAGAVQVDGIDLPSGASTVSVIQGYHTVTMQKTDIYDLDNETVNAIDSTASVSIAGKWSADALATAKATVKDAFNNVTCDVNKYVDCPNHTYHPKAGTYEILEMPGGNVNAYSSWIFTFTGDPTANMQLTPTTTTDQIKESGTCSMKLVVDGKSTSNYTGTWNGVLTITGTSFYSNIEELCDTSRA